MELPEINGNWPLKAQLEGGLRKMTPLKTLIGASYRAVQKVST